MRAALALVLAVLIGLGGSGLTSAQTPPPRDPPQVQELVKLLGDPAVREWLERQGKPVAAPATEGDGEHGLAGAIGEHFESVQRHFAAMAEALPRLPSDLGRGWERLQTELAGRSVLRIIVLLAAFLALGYGCQAVWVRLMRRPLQRLSEFSFDTPAERVRAVALRGAFGAGVLASIAIGTFGAFLLFNWPPLMRELLISALVAFLVQRAVFAADMILLAPIERFERFRVVPMSTAAAKYWHGRIMRIASIFAAGTVVFNMMTTLGMPEIDWLMFAYVVDFVFLVLLVEATLRRPEPMQPRKRFSRAAVTWFTCGCLVVLYALRIADAMHLFWLVLFIVGLPAAIGLVQRSVNHILRPPGHADASSALPSVRIVAFERGIRTALIVGATVGLARAWGVGMTALTDGDMMSVRLLRGVFSAAVILLLADFAWQVIKAAIDRALTAANSGAHPESEAGRQARMRTLLPILRNIILVTLIAFAAMMALSALGVEIGPLIAGAGVVGVAIGFGAQTLVRDVISGMFYLLDDAFRIGEYIQAGNYKGTVESFSLRSVKLRHHRGPLYTIPFGALGAVQNMSRDWVIDKFSVGVTYDTDLEKVKKLVKQIGKELAQDPEIAPHILETLKMQGVEQFGDFAIQVRMKMMTKPGEQFVARRRALALIKKSFDANGVKFAFPTVQIAGGDEPAASAAVAKQALELVKPAAG